MTKTPSPQPDDGGPAFPLDELNQQTGGHAQHPGMSLRDYFAAKAMAGWLASYPRDMEAAQAALGAHMAARLAYHFADAMLKARTE